MATVNKHLQSPGANTHNAKDPFTIVLDNHNYTLTAEVLQRQVDETLTRRKAWNYASLQFVSLNNGVLTIHNECRGITQTMSILIEPDKIHVSCDCGEQVHTLCVHSYRALEQLCQSSWGNYFSDYSPNGLVETAFAFKQYFQINKSLLDAPVRPKKKMHYVYPLSGEHFGSRFNEMIHWAKTNNDPPAEQTVKLTELSYFIILPFKNRLLPFIIPCMGILNKSATEIRGFHPFLSGTQNEYEHLHSENQKRLNTLSFELWKMVEQLPGLLMKMNEEQKDMAADLFMRWKTVWPLLMQEPFVFGYLLHRIRELKAKPLRDKLMQLQLVWDKPQLQFTFSDKGPFYQLQMQVMVQGKLIRQIMPSPTFLIVAEKKLFLLNNLCDAAIAEWMLKTGNCITVFKTHLKLFETDILKPLKEYYPVKLNETKNKPNDQINKNSAV